jgi:hypothetical protein
MRLGLLFLCLSLLSASARANAADGGNARATPHLSAMTFVGVYSYQNVDRAAYRPGPRVGGLLGVRLLPWLSLNGEVTYDESWIQSIEGGNPSEFFMDFALSPLFHWTHGGTEIVVGPEIGYFTSSETATSMGTGTEISSSLSGLAVGLNVGAFVRLNRYVSLGGLLSVEVRNARRYCQALAGESETCTTNQVLNSSVVLDDADPVALSFAALF